MTNRPNLLVVCGRNKRRSRTAEYIFKNDNRFAIRSVGLSPKSNRKITEKDVAWAHLILVMTRAQKAMLSGMYKQVTLPPVEVLEIEDIYEFMDEELIALLTERINHLLQIQD